MSVLAANDSTYTGTFTVGQKVQARFINNADSVLKLLQNWPWLKSSGANHQSSSGQNWPLQEQVK